MIKGNEEYIISLYEDANEQLTSDLLLVEHKETKKVIQDEIDWNTKRMNEIKAMTE